MSVMTHRSMSQWRNGHLLSDTEVARLLNSKGYRTKQGRLFSKEMVRDMLQNRTYLGEIRYKGYRRKSNGCRDTSTETQWCYGLN